MLLYYKAMQRYRINLTVSEELHAKLIAIQHLNGFRNVCDLATALLCIFVKRTEDNDLNLPQEEVNDIDEMFEQLSDYEPTPNNTDPNKRRLWQKGQRRTAVIQERSEEAV